MKNKIIIFIPISVLLVASICIVILFLNKAKTDELIGLWSIDGNTKYDFDGKDNGKLIVSLSEYKFTYKIKEDIISIDFENEKSKDVDYKYILKNNKLEITNIEESNLKFTLKKVDDKE